MMGHRVSTYNDIRMKGVEFLRGLYASSGLSIRPKTKLSKVEQLKTIIEAWGMDPNKILSKEALAMPHRTVVDTKRRQIEVLNQALKQAIIMELQESTKTNKNLLRPIVNLSSMTRNRREFVRQNAGYEAYGKSDKKARS